MAATGPQLDIDQVSRKVGATPGAWLVTWRIRNTSRAPLELVDSYVPHGKFRGQRVDLSSAHQLVPGAVREIELPVIFGEPPGTVVDNTFLILTTVWRETTWRILVRMTVESDSVGAPMARTELITTQKVGFSTSR